MCGIFFKIVNHMDCKIIEFGVKKRAFFTPCKTGPTNFESSLLKNFALHKLEDFDIVLGN
jgi:hypothetical protein